MSAAPTPYTRQNDFVTDATNNPNLTVPQIATPLDAEFNAVAASVNQTISRLGEVQRDDGKLRNSIVFSQALSVELLNLLNIEQSQLRGEWLAATAYAVRDVVSYEGGSYMCAVAHTSAGVDIANDIAAGRWLTLQARPANNAVRVSSFTGNGSQTVFLLTDPTEKDATNVFINGVYQAKSAYEVSGATLTFDVAPLAGTAIEISYGIIAEFVGIENLSVTSDKLAASAVTSDKIAASAVIADKIAASAVTATKIADGSVNSAKTAPGLFGAIAPVGAVLQSVTARNAAETSVTALIPADATIPQITEGTQILTASITPSAASNKVRGRVVVPCETSASTTSVRQATVAVFRGSAINSIAAITRTFAAINQRDMIVLEFEDSPNALTAQTYSVRVGSSVQTLLVNAAATNLGGLQAATLTLEEIKA